MGGEVIGEEVEDTGVEEGVMGAKLDGIGEEGIGGIKGRVWVFAGGFGRKVPCLGTRA